MPWLIAGLLIVGLIGLNIGFLLNALALRRDMKDRVERLRANLEKDANALVDHLFESK